MAEQPTMTISKIAIRVAAAGFGATVAGPLGCALGAAFGDALSGLLGEMVGKLVEEGGKEATKKLFDAGGDALAQRIGGSGGNLEAAYREALRLSLAAMRPKIGVYDDWFEHWERCLKTADVLRLDDLQLDDIDAARLAMVLRRTMVRLDAQGSALADGSNSVTSLSERILPDELEAVLASRLPTLFDARLQELLVSESFVEGFKEAQLQFQRFAAGTLTEIGTKQDVLVSGQALTNEMLSQVLKLTVRRAEDDRRIDRAEALALQAQGEAEAWKRQYLELAATNPSLDALLSTGDLDAAVLAKEEQRRRERHKAAQTSIELGKIHELRFDWARALEAYREAWRLEQSFDYGFKYAYLAQKQNRHNEAITVYEATRLLSKNSESAAMTLNNLAVLYRATQRMRDAERAYDEALSTYRQLAQENPEAYLPDVAMTLNNLALLYIATQRMRGAELACDEALSIRRQLAQENPEAYLPDVALTLNNLALLYSDTQRMRDAEPAYDEALSIYRQLAAGNPAAYLPYVATTLNNQANLYSDTQRMRDAELAEDEALSIRRQLAQENPEAYLPGVAMALNNLAILYRATQRMRDAEMAYDEALATYRQLAAGNPEAYLPNMATTLNNLANLYSAAGRGDEALRLCREAESILRPLWDDNPTVHGDQMARILGTLADFVGERGAATDEACRLGREALGIAYDSEIKARLQGSIARWCGDAEG